MVDLKAFAMRVSGSQSGCGSVVAGAVRAAGARNAAPRYSLATLAAIWSAILTAVFPGLLGHAATSMAMLLLTVNAR